MRIKLIILSLLVMMNLNSNAQQILNAEQSDPVTMGWMQGFPPAKDKIISAIDGSFFQFPALRYSVCHMRQFMPTTDVAASRTTTYHFSEKLDDNIDTITFLPLNSMQSITWKESLAKNYTDGMLILHKGKIVYEKYFGALTPYGVHAAMSVSKTFTGTLGALLVAEGRLDENKTAGYYVTELKGSAFEDATIRQILDMTTALKYSEDYSDPNAEVWAFSNSGNPFSKPTSPNAPSNYYEYLETVHKQGEHGDIFAYKTINTDALGWIITRVIGKTLPELLSERIWQPLGTHIDGYYQVDGAGIAFAGGGFNANMRDVGIFGEMIRNMGKFNNKQILPTQLIEDIMQEGSKEAFNKTEYASSLKNWSYRNMWWKTNNDHGAFAARGVHGQSIYIDPKAEMLIVRFASHPEAKNSKIDPTSLPGFQAVANYLMKK